LYIVNQFLMMIFTIDANARCRMIISIALA